MIPYIVHIQLCVAGQTILIFLNCIVCRKMWFPVTNQKKKMFEDGPRGCKSSSIYIDRRSNITQIDKFLVCREN